MADGAVGGVDAVPPFSAAAGVVWEATGGVAPMIAAGGVATPGELAESRAGAGVSPSSAIACAASVSIDVATDSSCAARAMRLSP